MEKTCSRCCFKVWDKCSLLRLAQIDSFLTIAVASHSCVDSKGDSGGPGVLVTLLHEKTWSIDLESRSPRPASDVSFWLVGVINNKPLYLLDSCKRRNHRREVL